MKVEIVWKDVVGFEGLYEVSDQGSVKSLKHGRETILSNSVNSQGYYQVSLYKGFGSSHKVHKLVQEAFGLPVGCVAHIDGDRLNNAPSNIKIITQRQVTQQGRQKGQLLGTSFAKRRSHLKTPWASRISIKGVAKHLGYFATELKAHKVYMKAVQNLTGEK